MGSCHRRTLKHALYEHVRYPARGIVVTQTQGHRRGVDIAFYVMLCIIWGSTWLVIKVGYGGLGPFNIAALRFFAAGLVLACIVPLLGVRWPQERGEWALVAW